MYNMETRRSFFKGIAAFAGGVVAAKASTYIPKKEEPKETIMVSSTITLNHEGKEYHPLVVEKTTYDGMEFIPTSVSHSFAVQGYKPKIREAKI
jgi:hypothetical protein